MLHALTGRRFCGPDFCLVSITLAFAVLFLASTSQPAQSQTYKVIYNFTAQGTDGATPYSGPILDEQGNLYGTTYLGGSLGSGTVYRLSPNGSGWTHTTLYNLKGQTDGAGPAFGSLVKASGRFLFGTTEGGGYFGTAFAVCACPQREYVIHSFGKGKDGAQPIGGLVLDRSGNLYGTTSEFGAYGFGNVFELTPSGNTVTETILYSFVGGNDPINPAAGVTLDARGDLYGTASLGGAFGYGAVYKLSRSGSTWKETVLYNFQNGDDGANPVGGVILDKAGNIYGTTFDGGVNGGGTVWEMSPSASGWTFNTIYSFVGLYGGPYNKLTFDANGTLYGFTNADGANGLGSIFKLTPGSSGWTYTDLHDFAGGTDGLLPYGSVAVDANGNIFGTASVGGTNNQGLVFEITP